MKKKLLILFVCAISVLGASATILFTSSCGKQTYTIGPGCFKDAQEAIDYYMELDDALCKNGADTEESEDDDDSGNPDRN